jgi:phospholipid/cholesterol/gamma-HCH transport system substrate-binding protein
MSRTSLREVRVGVIVVFALAGVAGLVGLASTGPGFLARRRSVDVVFRDGQGIRSGSLVRVAGLDAGRVTAVDLAEVDGILRARVRLSLPAELVKRLRQDVRVAIQASLTGQSCVNIVSTGRSAVPLVPGQLVQGVESSFFDPVLEQVGLGPAERSHLSHTIAEVRQSVDVAGPRLRQILGGLQETVGNMREATDAIRPALVSTASRLDDLSKRLDTAQIEDTLRRVNALAAHAEGILADSRPNLQATLTGVKDLSVTLRELAIRDGPKIDTMLDGFNQTRTRLDFVLAQAGTLTTQGNDLLTKNRSNLDRTFSNVRDASDFGVKLVGKLYGNPFYLSPFYKPTKEDVRAQEVYDAANTFLLGAKELGDTVTSLKALQAKPLRQMTPNEVAAYEALYKRAWALTGQLNETSRQLAAGLRDTSRR